MSLKEIFYPESKFGGFTDIDGTIVFYQRVNSLLEKHFVLLDVGCGRGAYGEDTILIKKNLRIFKTKVKKVIGIDIDKAAEKNPFLDEFILIDENKWSLDNDSIDIILCDSVLEHIKEPNIFFSEAKRVLKNGGYLCIRTPNSFNYITIISRLIPNKYHAGVIKKIQKGREEEDVFPTCYNCNSIGRIIRMMNRFGFDHVVYGYEAEPSYLSFSKIIYWFGVIHQKFSPNILKPAIFAFGKLNKNLNKNI